MELMELMSVIKEEIIKAEEECMKFEVNDNKSAGTRVRKHMQTIKGIAQRIRTEVQEIKNNKTTSVWG